MLERLLPLFLILAGEGAERCMGRLLADAAGLYFARRRCAAFDPRHLPCGRTDE